MAFNVKLTPNQVKWAVSKFPTMSDSEIADALENIVSADQIRAIRKGRPWSSLTGIGGAVKPMYVKKRSNRKSTSAGHPLYELTIEINKQIGARVRNLVRSRKITQRMIASALCVTESSVQSKIYRDDHNFSLAQILIMHEALFPDVSLLWIITGKYNEDEKPEYVSRAEFYEIDLMVQRIKTETNRVEKHK